MRKILVSIVGKIRDVIKKMKEKEEEYKKMEEAIAFDLWLDENFVNSRSWDWVFIENHVNWRKKRRKEWEQRRNKGIEIKEIIKKGSSLLAAVFGEAKKEIEERKKVLQDITKNTSKKE